MQEKFPPDDCSEQEVRSELERILQSPLFTQSGRLGRFLRFTVDTALSGNSDSLKEYVIGTEVYDRKPPYHPSQDSIVRTEARRLRSKLKDYYEEEGKDDPVFIYFRPGAYVPVFRKNRAGYTPLAGSSDAETSLLVKGDGVVLAVLPLADLSDRDASRQCALGVTEELIHALTFTDGVKLVSRASLTQAMTDAWDIPSLARRFGVSNVIEGTVREESGRLLITIRVLNADGFQVGSHRFETQSRGDISFEVHKRIASAFVSRARPEQSHIRRRKATAGNLMQAVYPLIIQGEALLDEGSASDIQAALTKFREAMEMAPAFARSYCGISHCYLELALRGGFSSLDLVVKAKEAAARAIELDAEMIETHSCLGAALALHWEWALAEKSFLHSMSLGLHASAYRQYGTYLTALGRMDEASHYIEKSQQIDPFSYRQKVARGKFLYLARQYEQGIHLLTSAQVYGPLPLEAFFYLALMYVHVGNRESAKGIVERIRVEAGAQTAMMGGIAELLALSGEADQALKIIEVFRLLSENSPVSKYRQALLLLALGDSDRALGLITEAFEQREAELVWLAADPRFDPLRTKPVFHDLLKKIFRGFASIVGESC